MVASTIWWFSEPQVLNLILSPLPSLISIGYTGKYTAEHITTNLPTDLKWAIAGRSHGKLEKLAAEIKPLNPDRRQPGGCFFPSLVSWHVVPQPCLVVVAQISTFSAAVSIPDISVMQTRTAH